MAGALPSDTVKNPKMDINPTTLVLSTHSYPTIDLQCSSHPSTSINAVKTYSKEASHSQTSLLQTGMGIGTEQIEEPKSTLKDEFQDLHLNLPVLEVLAHAPIYNAMLDKYVESIELGKKRISIRPRRNGIGAQIPYYARKDFLDCHFPREWEIARDAEINPFKDVLVFRRMDKPPKDGDGAWHAKIRVIFDEKKLGWKFLGKPEDGVATIKRRRHDIHGDGVRDSATMSGRVRIKVDLEPSTWRRRQEYKARRNLLCICLPDCMKVRLNPITVVFLLMNYALGLLENQLLSVSL
ncbi:hypothetical protein Tco_0891517 [Tanacetum coccineum]|uniref:Uncharacterized protein n=1 Tax=Tanacetum coccineum TaxID=301880 RepID=A0ABQ5C353_9ASTR